MSTILANDPVTAVGEDLAAMCSILDAVVSHGGPGPGLRQAGGGDDRVAGGARQDFDDQAGAEGGVGLAVCGTC